MSGELDDIGRETAAMMKTMLQLATLVALRTRERGQKEAEARIKVTEARLKEAREMQVREARDIKAKDPRNAELARMMEKPLPPKGVSLEKDHFSAVPGQQSSGMAATAVATAAAAKPMLRYDSPERRMAIAAHLAKIGVAPELAAVRMLIEVGQAQPPNAAVRERPDEAPSVQRAREMESRGMERTRN
ncbi:hypothetical protein D5S18_33745 [Nocardia panacis]|uniref:Uncharacterized protein n=1 Tax=Nocardia panacis TaxID=2340916 RepID=A0A3A4JIY5_9NOCA|nr:hypothetical protein [Nocardia panacis]RJO68377.1 hypothetical protein D5S18_33745 [Nocardia panacis]